VTLVSPPPPLPPSPPPPPLPPPPPPPPPSDPFNGGVQQEFVSASGAAGGDSAGVSGGGGAHLHPVLRGVDALRRLLQRWDAAVHADVHPQRHHGGQRGRILFSVLCSGEGGWGGGECVPQIRLYFCLLFFFFRGLFKYPSDRPRGRHVTLRSA